jgi:hypothetical protein
MNSTASSTATPTRLSSRFSRILRATALAVLVGGIGTWLAHGARLGWTQTSVVQLQRDDITGIDYPVRQAAFVAGVEVPLLAGAVALAFGAMSLVPRRRRASAARA